MPFEICCRPIILRGATLQQLGCRSRPVSEVYVVETRPQLQ